ncbi:hypothetical protein ACLD5O_01775 [Gardnerella leopoldii]
MCADDLLSRMFLTAFGSRSADLACEAQSAFNASEVCLRLD